MSVLFQPHDARTLPDRSARVQKWAGQIQAAQGRALKVNGLQLLRSAGFALGATAMVVAIIGLRVWAFLPALP